MPGLHSKPTSEVVEEQERPEVQPEDKTFNEQDVLRFPSGRHTWRQQGPYCVCRECPLSHAVFIGIENEMVGEDEDGKPILQKRDKVST